MAKLKKQKKDSNDIVIKATNINEIINKKDARKQVTMCIGRTDEWEKLQEYLFKELQSVWVSGEVGIGKKNLAFRLLEECRIRGKPVLFYDKQFLKENFYTFTNLIKEIMLDDTFEIDRRQTLEQLSEIAINLLKSAKAKINRPIIVLYLRKLPEGQKGSIITNLSYITRLVLFTESVTFTGTFVELKTNIQRFIELKRLNKADSIRMAKYYTIIYNIEHKTDPATINFLINHVYMISGGLPQTIQSTMTQLKERKKFSKSYVHQHFFVTTNIKIKGKSLNWIWVMFIFAIIYLRYGLGRTAGNRGMYIFGTLMFWGIMIAGRMKKPKK